MHRTKDSRYCEAVTAAHPISRAWLSTGETGAPNYDEFADDSAITEVIAKKPTSMLSVEMPHRAPEARAADMGFYECLPAAVERLTALQQSGRFAAEDETVVAYRISDTDGRVSYGLFCMVDTDEISTSPQEPGRVIRNEDVFIEKVEERAALNSALHHLLSPVLLVQNSRTDELEAALAQACTGEAFVTDTDESQRQHQIWPVADPQLRRQLCELAGGGDLIVADGNHRSLAVQVGGLPQFLAVVTTPQSVDIQPYHRLVSTLNMSASDFLTRLRERGADISKVAELTTPQNAGTVHMYLDGETHAVSLPDVSGSVVDRLDHARVEAVVFNDVLGMDAGDPHITYVGGDYPPEWLVQQVDSGAAQLAILIAPVTVDDFMTVNLERLKLPRKSTWFTPKARAGLVLSDLR